MARGSGSSYKIKNRVNEEEKEAPEDKYYDEHNTTGEQSKVVKRVNKIISVKKAMEQLQIAEFRKQMNFPEEVTRSRVVGDGSSTPQEEEEPTRSRRGITYSKGGKRGTRLVRSV